MKEGAASRTAWVVQGVLTAFYFVAGGIKTFTSIAQKQTASAGECLQRIAVVDPLVVSALPLSYTNSRFSSSAMMDGMLPRNGSWRSPCHLRTRW